MCVSGILIEVFGWADEDLLFRPKNLRNWKMFILKVMVDLLFDFPLILILSNLFLANEKILEVEI